MSLCEWGVTREEDVEASSGGVFADENVKDVEGDLVEEVAHDLEDEWRAVVGRWQGPHIRGEDELLQDVTHGSCVGEWLLFLK
jgi:hypothetical protein